MINVAIIGGSGYTGGELIRILLYHPEIKIKNILSNNFSGKNISYVHRDLLGDSDIYFTNAIDNNIDIIFLCVNHGTAKNIVSNIDINIRLIDLSQDFRLINDANFENRRFIYGLPEKNKEIIKNSNYIANPGCFATCIQLSLLPLAYFKYLINDIHISAITGSTGSGKILSNENHFSLRYSNISNYKLFNHQHIKEIKENIIQLQNSFKGEIYFVPYKGNFSRGIISTTYVDSLLTINEYKEIYQSYYKDHPFIRISNKNIYLKEVIGTNKCYLHLYQSKNKIIITSIIDNLIKGAVGQAVQNLNLMYNLEETLGLKLKSIGF